MTYLFAYASMLSPLLGICLGWRFYSALSIPVRYIFWFMVLSFLCDTSSLLLTRIGIANNLFVVHLWGLLEGTLVLLFFRQLLVRHKLLLNILLLNFVLLYLGDSFFLNGLQTFNGFSRAGEGLMIITLCVAYFYHVYDSESEIFIDRSPDFWIVVGLLVYFSGALFSFLLSTEIFATSNEQFYGSWILHNTANIAKNVLMTIALWKTHSNRTSNLS